MPALLLDFVTENVRPERASERTTHSGAKGTKEEEGFFPHKRVERKEEKTTQLGRKKKREERERERGTYCTVCRRGVIQF